MGDPLRVAREIAYRGGAKLPACTPRAARAQCLHAAFPFLGILAMTPSLLLAALLAPAADPKPGDAMIQKYLQAETARISRNVLDGAKTKAEWEAKRPKLRQQFLDMLGLWPLPEKTPLKATVTGTLTRGNVVIDKLHYQSRPGLYVTANLYRPKTTAGKKLPAILYVCGHANKGRDGNKTAYQHHGLWFANNGYVCLIVDTLQLGEVAGTHHGTYKFNRFWWQDRGYTPAGVECWNGIRGIDYLLSRPDVDPERIGMTGRSGGGATTVWVAAADDRVKVAVPVSGMSDLESYVSHRVINGHCDCMFFVNTYQWEWTTSLALFAPKPLLFANGDSDPIFPMDGNRRIVARLRHLYELLGKPENVDEYVSKGGHSDRPDLQVAAFRFMNRHLKGDARAVEFVNYPKIPGQDLRVFPEDGDLPRDAINATADETFVPKANVKLPTKKEDFAAWKAGLVKQLREKSFRALPEPAPPFDSEPHDFLRIDVQRKTTGDVRERTLIVLNPVEDAKTQGEFWAKQFPNGSLMAIHTRGGGETAWTRKNPPNTVERSFALLGQTVDTGRVIDVAWLIAPRKKANKNLRLVARGQAGILAAYAALLYPGTISEVVIIDPPASHRDGPHFLNVERVLDLPTALGLLAPDVKLTLIGAKDKAFDKTAAIYKLAGATGKFERK
jgi:dienelactone hydrolase